MFFADYIPVTLTSIVEVPKDRAATINVITVISEHDANITVNFWITRKAGGSKIPLCEPNLIINSNQRVPILAQPVLNLEEGDIVQCQCNVESKLSCIVDGKLFTKFQQ